MGGALKRRGHRAARGDRLMGARIELRLPSVEQATVDELLARATEERWAERLFDRDTSLWTDDPDVAANITDRLGWLDAPEHFTLQIPALEGFGDAAVEAGFDSAVVMGMGGSSLAPDVFHRTFGTTEGYLALRVLDSTDPAAVAATVDDLDPLETLWIVASKSGTTTEPLAFLADRWAGVAAALKERDEDDQQPGEFFVAISDPGKSIQAIPHHDDLREQFLNPPDIGGRYSALTYVGLVPASLIGIDLDSLLAAGHAMLGLCREPDAGLNPGLQLGLAIGGLARAGRDKLTILADPPISTFGAWAEQLIAESTGKQGVGVVRGMEPARKPDAYGPDRFFVALTVAGEASGDAVSRAEALAAAGHPVVLIELDDPIDIAGEMVRWEVATAIAGAGARHRPLRPAERRGRQGANAARARRRGRRGGRQRRRRDRRGRWRDPRRGPRRREPHGAPRSDPPGAPAPELPRDPGVHRTLQRHRRADRRDPGGARDDEGRDHRGLRAPLPPLHRPAPQGRPVNRGVPAADLRPPCRSADSGLALFLRPAYDAQARGDREALRAQIDPSSTSISARTSPPTWPPSSRPSGARSAEEEAMQIGFIGLGRMGANMVRRLVRDGHSVVAHNRTVEKAVEWRGGARGRP